MIGTNHFSEVINKYNVVLLPRISYFLTKVMHYVTFSR